ncbi:glucosyltransferase [Geranomyces variabilis]|uniref:Dol-P-Glc:Glc(2)Man(9)GlcNAc(2)-PP-Dol alpha-1,2-glucosyltransferase n=1 Tax=Geranomyces variabilis TaxID=109894 RepID=A0AAD5TII5_9FUNG|nr:glucosyltransferase [Geranomyces variabilis]
MGLPKPSTALLFLGCGSVLMGGSYFLSDYVGAKAPEPYMDEIFHIRQAQHYCRGEYIVWDQKITTPPGLYATSVALTRLFGLPCTASILRLHNLAFLAGTFAVLVAVHRTLHPHEGSTKTSILNAFTLSLLPISWFFHMLYYTDPGSTFLVLLAYLATLKGWHKSSAATNVAWVLFMAGVAAMRVLSENQPPSRTFSRVTFSDLEGWGGFAAHVTSIVITATQRFGTLVLALWPYMSVALLFAGFVEWNGGIVLGDRSNHIATIHIPQLYYFASSLIGFSALSSDIPGAISAALQRFRSFRSGCIFVVTTAALALLMCWSIHKFTIEHPFLLADNRHYSFYVWKNIYRRHQLVRYAAVIGYLSAIWVLGRKLASAQPVLLVLLFVVATAATLVPTPLLDFRYYVLPFLLFRLHVRSPSTGVLLVEAIAYAAVNLATVWLFGERPFRWASEPDAWQRFMW